MKSSGSKIPTHRIISFPQVFRLQTIFSLGKRKLLNIEAKKMLFQTALLPGLPQAHLPGSSAGCSKPMLGIW
jgi:hypothetical protein